MNNILMNQIESLQMQYLNILKYTYKNITTENYIAIVDEILVFWKKHKNIVLNIIQHYVLPLETFVFAGADMVDIEEYEHYPFKAIGYRHLVDDPICRYFDIIEKIDIKNAQEEFYNQAILTIEDNIKIIERCFPHIIILPLRYLLDENYNIIQKGATDAFLSMFNETINTLDDYYKLETIKEIHSALLPEAIKSIVFDNKDDVSDEFTERFNSFILRSENTRFLNNNHNKIFMFVIMGYISQAIDILMMCAHIQCVPYIRSDITFQYIILLSGNFINISEIKQMIIKSSIAHILYINFNKNAIEEIEFKDYVSALTNIKSLDKLINDLSTKIMESSTLSLSPMVNVVNEYLNQLYSHLKIQFK